MAEALKTFREGEDILASETNENNQFLLSKLSDNAAQVQQYVEGEVATIKSNVSSVQATLQNNIDALDAKKPIYIVEAGHDGDSGYEVYSNGKRVEWGAVSHAGGEKSYVIAFKKPFETANYNVSGSWTAKAQVGDKGLIWSCSTRKADSVTFYIQTSSYNSQACTLYWRAEGY
jgi:hypothetical protein